MNKPQSFVSPAVLIEPDHEAAPAAKRRKLNNPPITVVSALLSLCKPACPTQAHQAKTSSFPISVKINGQAPSQIKATTVKSESDTNHVSDDEDSESIRRPLSKPCLPQVGGMLALPIQCRSSDSTAMQATTRLSCVSYTKREECKATSILPIFLPRGRPLSAAPCLPSVAPGEIYGVNSHVSFN